MLFFYYYVSMLVLFTHFCAAVLCFVTQRLSNSFVRTRHLLSRQNNGLDAQGIGPPYTYSRFVLSRNAPSRCFTRANGCDVERLIGNLFLGDMLWMQNYVTTASEFFRGTQSHLNKLCSQSKGRDIIFHLKKKKKC